MAKVEAENVRFNQGTRMVSVDLEVRPFRASDQRRYYIIIFRDHKGTPKSRAKSSDKPAPTKDELDMVREELEFSRARLESVIQEKETGLEEVRAAYEEIQSSNEELQSTNEELETAKEELESINEELTTVNDQLDRRNHELSEAHDFIANLLASIEIPIVVVDSDLRIRRFEGAKALFNLREQDIGRRLTELALQVDVSNLPDLIRQVIDHLVPVRREVQDKSGHWYSMMIRPYRTADDRIEGAVLSFMDIDELVRTRSGDGGRRVRRVGSKPKGSRRGQEQGS